MAAKTKASSPGSQGGSSSKPSSRHQVPLTAAHLPTTVCNAVDVHVKFQHRGCDLETVSVKYYVGACLSLQITSSTGTSVFCNQCKPTGFMDHTINFNCPSRLGSVTKKIKILQSSSCQPCKIWLVSCASTLTKLLSIGNSSNWRNRTQPPALTPVENLTKVVLWRPPYTVYDQKEIIEQPTGNFSKGDSKENNTCKWKFANRDFRAVGRSNIEWFRLIIFNTIIKKDMKRSCPTRVELWTAFRIFRLSWLVYTSQKVLY